MAQAAAAGPGFSSRSSGQASSGRPLIWINSEVLPQASLSATSSRLSSLRPDDVDTAMGQSSMNLNQRLRWRADELVDLILQKREGWWPGNLNLAITTREDGDWMAVSGGGARDWEPELAFSIARAVGEVRSRNAWNGY